MSWGGESGGTWLNENFFHFLNEDGEIMNAALSISCNTRKSRDKTADRRHSVGIFVGALPCGRIVPFDQLYGSEGTEQVYGLLINFFDSVDNREKKLIELHNSY